MSARHETGHSPRHLARKPLFTKRHYEALAEAFSAAKEKSGLLRGGLPEEMAGIRLAQEEVMRRLMDDNGRFDHSRFDIAALAPYQRKGD